MLRSVVGPFAEIIKRASSFARTKDNHAYMMEIENVRQMDIDIRENWARRAFSTVANTPFRRWIRFQQAELISLSNEIGQGEQEISEPVILLLELIEGLITYLRIHFLDPVNDEQSATRFFCRQCIAKIENYREAIVALFSGVSGNLELQNVVLQGFDSFAHELKYGSASYHRSILLVRLAEKIKSWFLANIDADEGDVFEFLYALNFNSSYLSLWYGEKISLALHAVDEADKNEAVQKEEKRLQANLLPGSTPLWQHYPGIERLCLDRLVMLIAEKALSPDTSQVTTNPEQLAVNLSVPQLALFIRLCYLEGCFQVESISKMMRFFVRHFITKRQSHISVKSFGRSFYIADQSTAAVVRSLLQKMIKQIDKMYFNK